MKKLLCATLVGAGLALEGVGISTAYASSTESTGQYVSNSAVTAKVKAALLATKGLDSNNISVTTVGNVVTLTGTVDNTAQVELAQQVAAGVNGVNQVQNNLKSAN